MPTEALQACSIEPSNPNIAPQQQNSALYNAMINPMTKMNIKAALWYQGEKEITNRWKMS